jgi:uncharacterized protein (TIGR03437 family)
VHHRDTEATKKKCSGSYFLCVLCVSVVSPLFAQTGSPIAIGTNRGVLPSCVNATGSQFVFGSTIAPDGSSAFTVDIYTAGQGGVGLRRLTKLNTGTFAYGATAVSLTPDGLWAGYSSVISPGNMEEIHLLDVARGADKTISVDTQGCILPLCFSCFFTCLRTPHVTDDGSAVLYAASRQTPFFLAKSDGSAAQNLPVFSGQLAPAGKRVISKSGLVAFTSNAPAGPTFAAAATQVYVMNLNGTGVKQVTAFNDANILARDATISADGTMIAFLANFDTGTQKATQDTRLFRIRADGTALQQITSGETPASSPSLSSDGSRLAFASQGQILVVVGSLSIARVLTNFKVSAAQDPVIGDDGSFIAFGLGPQSGSSGAVYVVSADGRSPIPVYTPRSLNAGGVAGAVSGSLASAYGTNFISDDTIAQAASLPLPQTLAGVSLTMNGAPLPLLAATPWQINAQIPPQQGDGQAAFAVRTSDGTLTPSVTQTVQSTGPFVYLVPSVRPNQAAVLHGGTGILVDAGHPATAGEAIEIYASGLGSTTPVVPAGTAAPADPPARTSVIPTVNIGGKAAQVLFSGLAPGLVGVYQVNVIVPDGLRAGDNFVSIQVGTVAGTGGIITTR